MTSRFLKLAFLSESKRDWIKKTYGLDGKQINLCLKADPEEGTYVPWVANQLKNETIRLPEDESKIREQLTEFDKLKNSPNFDSSKDIGTYSPSDLYELIESSKPENLSEKEQIRRLIERGAPGAELVLNKGDYKVFKVTDPELLMVLSSNTNWCTTQLNFAKFYLKDSPNYIFYYQNHPYAQWDSKDQLMDAKDISLVDKDSNKISTNKTLLEFYNLFQPLHDRFWFTKEDALKSPRMACWYANNVIGGRWPAAEPTIMQDPQWAYEYAKDVIEGRWRAAEPTIMKNPQCAYLYAVSIIHDRWPEAEPYIMKDPEYAYYYALSVIEGRWPEAEPYIKTNPQWAYRYSTYIFGGRFSAAEPYIMKDPQWAYYYAKDVIEGRWRAAEPTLMKSPWRAFYYTRDVIKGRWPEGEPYLMKDPQWAYYYALNIIKGRWREAEPTIMKDPLWAYMYARDIIKGRWRAAEPVILASNKYAKLYKRRFKIK